VKSIRQVVPMLVALALAATLSGCSKDPAPTAPGSLDQAPPAAPTRLSAELEASTYSPVLEWAPSTSPNVAGYEIYLYSPSPERESAYVLVAQTDAATTRYPVPWSYVRTSQYYRLRAVSTTAVKSEWSAVAQVTVGPPQADPDPTPSPDDPRVPVHH